ncbi:putative sulfate exporter family transporter, partial [Escherichia coli]|uniref:putative sulfate exporter family transporter n=1 Tax=Escherichia coli TaxID=562 RepID=UPI0019395212|nr:putative sulfate exporter family transporter [Escherichia coli]
VYQFNTLASSTFVKLTRTLAIIPVTLVLFSWQSRNQYNMQALHLNIVFPLFILYFILPSLLTTLLTSLCVSSSFFTPLNQLF